MTTPKPVWVQDDWTSYEEIVESWGAEILSFDTHGSYQGDHTVVLKTKDGQYGFTVIGYGSCGGCDALEAAHPWYNENADWTEIVELSESLRCVVHWEPSALDMADYLDSRDAANEWYLSDEEIKTAIADYISKLQLGIW